ncbi:MAG: crossover junction endodeoxyribonuclease RuvC [Gemmatimonadota bacterium]|nr:crossover junction endodeoxyribonuclease RuvC [Gemmatimonadota bacterium]
MLVLGIDPGTAATGYGVVRRGAGASVTLIECGVIRTSASEPLAIRIREIYDAVVGLIERHRPGAVSVEDVFYGKNAKSALKLGHARGAILLAAAHHDLIIAEYAPREIKKAVVGTGNATKDQVGFMVKQQLRLKEAPTPADAADGVAAALCHCMVGSFPA